MHYFYLFVLLVVGTAFGQNDSEIIKEIEKYQTSENVKFSSRKTTILNKKEFKAFTGLDYYPINLDYRVEADFIRTPNEKPFLMRTSTDRQPEYVKYGEVHFTVKGEKLKLNVYKSTTPYKEKGYEDYLFLPFTDLTSGDGSYGGGRFLDIYIPEGTTIVLDFNKAYNPYCAYSHDYSCPIPPKENDLLVRIEAGVKDFDAH